MAYFVYILYSKKLDKYYKGHTKNVDKRLYQHNNGYSVYTKSGVPWILVLSLPKYTKLEAVTLERKLKNLNRKRLEAFIKKYNP